MSLDTLQDDSRSILEALKIFQNFIHFYPKVALYDVTLTGGFDLYKPIASPFWARHLIEHVLIFKRFSENQKRIFEFQEKSKL